MNIQNENIASIVRTLELIQNAVKLIEVNKKDPKPDIFGIEQYEKHKMQLTKELYSLLAEYDIPTPLLAA
jgi:hypothetical protein